MTTSDTETTDLHERQSRAVASAVHALAGRGDFPPEAIIEGAVKGATAVALSLGASPATVADLLDDLSAGLRNLPERKAQ